MVIGLPLNRSGGRTFPTRITRERNNAKIDVDQFVLARQFKKHRQAWRFKASIRQAPGRGHRGAPAPFCVSPKHTCAVRASAANAAPATEVGG
jgi:hypothetical protein